MFSAFSSCLWRVGESSPVSRLSSFMLCAAKSSKIELTVWLQRFILLRTVARRERRSFSFDTYLISSFGCVWHLRRQLWGDKI